MASRLNTAFMKLPRRADQSGREQLINTFVDVGPLFTLLSSIDHQILYGRRGTGKTHALQYLAQNREDEGDAVAYVDLRTIGSSGGVYEDFSRTVPYRATCLLVDVLSAIHSELRASALKNPTEFDLSRVAPALDELAHAITEVRVVGSVESERTDATVQSDRYKSGIELAIGEGGFRVGLSDEDSADESRQHQHRLLRSGDERFYVNFGSVGAAFRSLAAAMSNRRNWILIDEWSSVPWDLQPYLADLLRRSVFPTAHLTVKIAAIEQRSQFRLSAGTHGYVGIEVGADAA